MVIENSLRMITSPLTMNAQSKSAAPPIHTATREMRSSQTWSCATNLILVRS